MAGGAVISLHTVVLGGVNVKVVIMVVDGTGVVAVRVDSIATNSEALSEAWFCELGLINVACILPLTESGDKVSAVKKHAYKFSD